MNRIIEKYLPWVLVTSYMSLAVVGLAWMVMSNHSTVIHNEEMLELLAERKEYHISVSEDNNRLLREIEAYIHERAKSDDSEQEENVSAEDEGY